jgi:hypothetical protein
VKLALTNGWMLFPMGEIGTQGWTLFPGGEYDTLGVKILC